jgi:hypothetical protein
MSSGGIQFFGVDQAVEAYERRDVPAFSLWQGKQMLHKFDGSKDGDCSIATGAQELRSYLDMLYENSTAIYTLRVYEDLKPGQKIKPSTEHDGSFNFRINAPEQRAAGMGGGNNNLLLVEMQKINRQLAQINGVGGEDEDEDEDDKEPTIEEIAMGFLNEPEKLLRIVNVGKQLLGISPAPATVGNINRLQQSHEPGNDPDLLTRLGNAINILEQHDPKLVEHLEKLAKLAQQDKTLFNAVISKLDLI